MAGKKIVYKGSVQDGLKKLQKLIGKLGASGLTYEIKHNSVNPSANIIFTYNGKRYELETSMQTLAYRGINVEDPKDMFIMIVQAVEDLVRVKSRGILDFSGVMNTLLKIEFIEIPEWAEFMGFNTRPRNMMEVEDRFKELSKGSMNPNTNPDDFMKLQNARELARQYFKVE